MSNENFKDARLGKVEEGYFEFIAEVKSALGGAPGMPKDFDKDKFADWSRRILQGSLDVSTSDPNRQDRLEQMRRFAKDLRKALCRAEKDPRSFRAGELSDRASGLLALRETPAVPTRRLSP